MKVVKLIAVLAFVSISINPLYAHTENGSNLSTQFEKFIDEQGLALTLKNLLGDDNYESFTNTFQTTTEVIRLKNGGLFIEGRTNDKDDHRISAIFVNHAGGVSTATYNKKTNEISYQSSDIKVEDDQIFSAWTKIYTPKINVLEKQSSLIYKKSEWDEAEKSKDFRQLASLIWDYEGAQITKHWNFNSEVTEMLAKVVNEINTCTTSVRGIYMPLKLINNGIDPFSQIQDIIEFITVLKTNRRAESCITMIASRWRSPIEMASMGI